MAAASRTQPLLIVGQGLAGSWLGWLCERAGVPFRVLDLGHAAAASRVAAGLITPLTGRRLVPTWRIEELPRVLDAYRTLEAELRMTLVTPLRIRRQFRDSGERARWAPRLGDPAAARWLESADERGLWLQGGTQVETARLVAALRERWRERGWLEEKAAADAAGRAAPRVVWCTGAATCPAFDFVPWERAHGEILAGELAGVEPGVVLNDGQWVLGEVAGRVRVGATYERGRTVPEPTAEGREQLQAAAQRLSGQTLTVLQHEAGVRVTTPDRRPVVGWHPEQAGCGILGGLASKGALWAPLLAEEWLEHLRHGTPFAPVSDVRRFWRGPRGA